MTGIWSKEQLIDRFQRHINYLRISITDRCNLKCAYCVPRESIPKLRHGDILTYEEILRLVEIAVRMGITKARVTGGEPLVRKGSTDFLKDLADIRGLTDVSLTTNGVMLYDYLEGIKRAGVTRLNISMDTLDRRKYKAITGVDAFDRVWEGINAAREMGFSPIKINAVALRGINDSELIDLAALSLSEPYHVRFIECMPVGHHKYDTVNPLLTPEIKARIETLGPLSPVDNTKTDGPARRFRFENAGGEIGFISALSHHFCDTCNRLRLTADGYIRPCLLSDVQEDIKTPLREGASEERLAGIFLQAVRFKQSGHHLARGRTREVCRQMSTIGG